MSNPLGNSQASNADREPKLRTIFETVPRSGPWNMAIDEALLENALLSGDAVLRWYRWESPTLSLGYFQEPPDLQAQPLLRELPLVRRLSGGGAILHDQEWTYSCVLPPSHPLTSRPHDLYLVVHQAIIQTLSSFRMQTRLRGESLNFAAGEPFLCFLRGDPCDVLHGPHKVLGSAQRRRRGAVLQHGSLILRSSRCAPEIPGLRELSGISPDEMELGRALEATVARSLEFPPVPDELSPAELSLAETFLQTRYAGKIDWNRPAFDSSRSS